jgi:hypothetical protein
MAEELKDRQVHDESEETSEQEIDGKKEGTAYEKKAQDLAGRDWTKRRSFKPEGTV